MLLTPAETLAFRESELSETLGLTGVQWREGSGETMSDVLGFTCTWIECVLGPGNPFMPSANLVIMV